MQSVIGFNNDGHRESEDGVSLSGRALACHARGPGSKVHETGERNSQKLKYF
jgi:hypothetical protein